MLQTLQPKRLYKQIADMLEKHIKNGDFAAGSYLPPERDLAQQLGVSRSSVREALIALEVRGFVDIRVGNGVRVCSAEQTRHHHSALSEQENDSPFQIIEAQVLIEGEIAGLAAEKATAEHIERVRESLQQMQEVLPILSSLPEQSWAEADRQFHERIVECTGNEILSEQLHSLWVRRASPIFRRIEKHYASLELKQQTLRDHEEILLALSNADAEQARLSMKKHLQRVALYFSE